MDFTKSYKIEFAIEAIEALTAAERITKGRLIELADGLLNLHYSGGNGDKTFELVNKVLGACTPRNKMYAQLFFAHMLPFAYDAKSELFNANLVGKNKIKAKCKEALEFVNDIHFTFWDWIEANIAKPEPKAKDFKQLLNKLLEKALQGEGGEALTVNDVIDSIVTQEGVTASQANALLAAISTEATE